MTTLRLHVQRMNMGNMRPALHAPPMTPPGAIHLDVAIKPEKPLTVGLKVELYTIPLKYHKRRNVPKEVDVQKTRVEKKMGIEGELEKVIAVSDSGVSFLLKHTNAEGREEAAIIRVPNEPGKTVDLTEEQRKGAWKAHMSRAPPILEEDIKIEEPIDEEARRREARIKQWESRRKGNGPGRGRYEPYPGGKKGMT